MSRFKKDIRIVVEGAEFADYFWPAMEQFVECSHDYWRSNGAFAPNVTIRLAWWLYWWWSLSLSKYRRNLNDFSWN
jgi:hypothetical protein